MNDWLTTTEAAQLLGLTGRTVRRLCEIGRFPNATQPNRAHWRIPRHDVEALIERTRPSVVRRRKSVKPDK